MHLYHPIDNVHRSSFIAHRTSTTTTLNIYTYTYTYIEHTLCLTILYIERNTTQSTMGGGDDAGGNVNANSSVIDKAVVPVPKTSAAATHTATPTITPTAAATLSSSAVGIATESTTTTPTPNQQHTNAKKTKKKSNINIVAFRIQNDPECSLVEVLLKDGNEEDDDNNDHGTDRFVQALCVRVEPRACSRVVKALSSALPLEDALCHLKRVRRRPTATPTPRTKDGDEPKHVAPTQTNPHNPPPPPLQSESLPTTSAATSAASSISASASPVQQRPKKRQKKSSNPNFVLELLIGTRSHLLQRLDQQTQDRDDADPPPLSSSPPSDAVLLSSLLQDHPILLDAFGIGAKMATTVPTTLTTTLITTVTVPRHGPRSETEWREHNQSHWPTHYYPLKFDEHLQQKSALSQTEIDAMKLFAKRCISTGSVLIVDPNRNSNADADANAEADANNTNSSGDDDTIDLSGIVSNSRNEQALQDQDRHTNTTNNNPLATPILLALQGVSRWERRVSTVTATAKTLSTVSDDASMDDQQQKQEQEHQKQQGNEKNTADNNNDNNDDDDDCSPPPPPHGNKADKVGPTSTATPGSSKSSATKGLQQQQQQQQQLQKKRQYICTGYDMYSYYEPTIFEAMACLHSRLRRLIYFVPSDETESSSSGSNSNSSSNDANNNADDHDHGNNNSNSNRNTGGGTVWGRGISKHGVHRLKGTNHNYRAFEYRARQSSFLKRTN